MPGVDKAVGALSALPFHDIIAGPLNACVEAQSQAALSTVNFIQQVGLNTKINAETNQETIEAVYVYFNFIQSGRKVTLSVPLLTIVPIPYICINTIDINFKAKVTGIEASTESTEDSHEQKTESESTRKKGLGIFRAKTTSKINASVSSKKDSKSTQSSEYSIESTIDVAVHASQDSMPAGMSKILELLNASVDLCKPEGELIISENALYLKNGEKAYITISYKSPEGLLEADKIKVEGLPETDIKVKNNAITCTITGSTNEKTYKVTVNGNEALKDGEEIKVYPVK